MKNNILPAKRGKIPPYQLFCILFVSRLVVTLTYIQSIINGKLAADLLISIVASYLASIIMSMPVIFCIKKYKNPLKNKWISPAFGLYFIYLASLSISRFSYFASSRLHPQSNAVFFIVLILIAVCYAVSMGIEGLGRFSVFNAALLIFAIIIAVAFNIKNFSAINFFPSYLNSHSIITSNVFILSANTVEPAVLLALSDRVNGKAEKTYFAALSTSYLTIFVLMGLCVGVMGASASLQSFPIFTLFQMAYLGGMSRLDIVHTAFWIFGVFLKCSVLLYCASIMFEKYSHKTKSVAVSGLSVIVCLLMTGYVGTMMTGLSKTVNMVLALIFCIIIPIISLIFIKKQKGEELLEKF